MSSSKMEEDTLDDNAFKFESLQTTSADPTEEQQLNRRAFLHSTLGASVVGGIIVAGCLTDSASAQSTSNDSGIWFKADFLTRVCDAIKVIRIEADKFVFCLAGGGTNPTLVPDVTKAYFERLANDAIEFNRIRGISLAGIKKISFTKDPLPGGVMLETLNEGLFKQLQRPGCEVILISAEDESCLCSWCYFGCEEDISMPGLIITPQ